MEGGWVLTITLTIKALTVNQAWQGRRFSTPAKKYYEAALRFALPKVAVAAAPYYRVEYDFHLRSFALSDWDNLVKVTQDCIVKRGIISDDRHIIEARVRKFPAKVDRIVVRIEACKLQEE